MVRSQCVFHLYLWPCFQIPSPSIVFLPPCGTTRDVVSSFMRFLYHTQWHTYTLGRTSLDEWSARNRDLYLTTHNNHNRRTSTLPASDLRLSPRGYCDRLCSLFSQVKSDYYRPININLKHWPACKHAYINPFFIFLSYSDLFLAAHCTCEGLFLHINTLNKTHTNTHTISILWTRDRPIMLTTDSHPYHRWDSKPQSQ
jgi:hypothetical protein